MFKHGINTYKADTKYTTMRTAEVGVPFFVGCAPCHRAGGFKGKPQIAYTFEEAKELLGYSDEWRNQDDSPKWNLCQAMDAFFNVFQMGPAVFYNLFDPATHKTAVASASVAVSNKIAKLPADAIIDSGLVVKATENGDALVLNTDYEASYTDDGVEIEIINTTNAEATSLYIAYNKANVAAITATDIGAAFEKVELCKGTISTVPDLFCAPGWSKNPAVAAVMAAKAGNIGGLFRAKAVVDLDTSSSGADTYDDVLAYKNAQGYTDENMIVCWPLVKIGEKLYDYSTIVCGMISSIDADNEGVPYESPSNKILPITACVNAAGTEVMLTVAQADTVSVTDGVVTALSYDGWRLWGNYTGAYSAGETDVAKIFIATSRMQDFLCNQFVNNYWNYLDQPLKRVVIDAIVNSYNSFLAGLTGSGMLYGGEIRYVEGNNPTASLIAGKFRLDCKAASPVPAQQIDMYVEYDVEALTSALSNATA